MENSNSNSETLFYKDCSLCVLGGGGWGGGGDGGGGGGSKLKDACAHIVVLYKCNLHECKFFMYW